MEAMLHHITRTHYIVMTDGSRWEPAPGEQETVATWTNRVKIRIRQKFGTPVWDHELTNTETAETILARREL